MMIINYLNLDYVSPPLQRIPQLKGNFPRILRADTTPPMQGLLTCNLRTDRLRQLQKLSGDGGNIDVPMQTGTR
jgi:hypothetical protein